MNRKLLLVGCGMFLCSTCGIDTVPSGIMNKLQKAFYYPADQSKNLVDIDLGRIVLLFSAQAQPNSYALKRIKQANQTKDVYLFPLTTIAGSECQKLVKNFNKSTHGDYTFRLRYVTGKTPGLELTLGYDSKKVSVEPRLFDTINAFRGLEFRFYNKGLTQEIKKRFSSSRRVASHLKKKEQLWSIVGMAELIPAQLDCWA